MIADIMLEKYLQNPCRASSIPYWKTKTISLSENMLLLHHDHFIPSLLESLRMSFIFACIMT